MSPETEIIDVGAAEMRTASECAGYMPAIVSATDESSDWCIALRLGGLMLYRHGPVFELIKRPGISLSAHWYPEQKRFRKCRINGRFVTESDYRNHR